MAEAELKRLLQSRRGYKAHLTRLFTATTELLERCNSSTPNEDDLDTLVELISQLERKKGILADLDKQISAAIDEEELEAEVLEAEELHSQISKSIMKGKRLQRRLQALDISTLAPHSNALPTPSGTSEPLTLEAATETAVELAETRRLPLTLTDPADTRAPPGNPTHTLPAAIHDICPTNTTVRLPRLDLPTFSGNALEWQPFWDGFDAAVHTNPAISEVQKLNYLRSLIKGEASQVIAGFPLTSDSYEHSLALLKDRYGTPYKLIMAHMQAFVYLSSPPNTLSGLQQFHDTVERHIRSLSTLGKSTDSYADILVPIILNKLPLATIKNMAREHDSNDWSLTDLQQAIKKEVRVFKAEIMTGNPPSGIHPSAAFHTGLVKTANRSIG